MQRILTILTKDIGLRSDAIGWSCDDGSLVREGPIGRTPAPSFPYSYDCPLRAIGAGWRLMGPPVPPTDKDDPLDGFLWYFDHG